MTKKQISYGVDEKLYKELKKARDETGLPISRLLDLKLKGYKVVKIKEVEKNEI